MARIVWAEPALLDLDAIADYIALDNPGAAHRLVRQVFSKVDRLRRFPKIGSVPPEIPDLPYRQLQSPPCRAFYRIERDIVYVVHVLRGERLLRREILEKRFEDI
jgi:plasmid stabilization system protein ParE